ncbi:MAG TPA: AI-2E family transporter [Candidatus Limnocylindrales bacterium]
MGTTGSPPAGESARAEANRWFARGVGFFAGGLLILALTTATIGAGSVVLLVFLALLIASALSPLVDRLRSVPRIGRGPAILLVYLSFFAAVAGIALLLVPVMASQTSDLAAQLPAVDQRLEAWAHAIRPTELASSVGAMISAAKAAIDRGPFIPAPGQIVSTGLSLAEAIAAVVTVLALVYFWLTERQRLQRFALSFLPAERRGSVREAWNSVELRLGGWVRGQLALMLALGVMTGAAYSLLGLPSGPLLGLIAGLAEVIPFIGPVVGVVPALLLAAAFRPDLVIVVLIVYIVIQLVESNVLVPLVMRNAVGVSPFLLTVSLLAGGALGGLLGAMVSVPIVAAVEAILERLQDRAVPVAQDAASAPIVTPASAETEAAATP